MDATVALADTMIARSSLVPGVEVIVAGPAQLRFPPRLSGMLGICVKSGPSHLVKADSRDRWYPAGGVCIRPPGCVWETTTERNGFVSIDLPVAFFPEGSFAGSMSFAPRGALPDLGLKAQRLLAADSELLAEQLIVELVTGVQEIGASSCESPAGIVEAFTALANSSMRCSRLG